MIVDKFGQMVYDEAEIFDIVMHDNGSIPGPFLVNEDIDVQAVNKIAGFDALVKYLEEDISIEEFDQRNQQCWQMPDHYKELDIAAHVLSLCNSDAELQRCGEELLMYMDRDLFDLLRYMKYLVDTMELNNVIWGVGRGSSVSSYVLYKLKVHKIDSMYYNLDVREFLR